MSKITLSNSDKIICISEDIKNNLVKEKGVPEEKIEVVYNWVDENAVVPVAKEDNPLLMSLALVVTSFMWFMQET